MDLLRHCERWTLSGEAVTLPDGPAIVTGVSGPWVPCGEQIEVVRVDALQGAVEALRECRETLADRQVSGRRFREALARADAILDVEGGSSA